MIQRFVKAYLKLMKYAAFIGIIGGIASFVDPNHGGLIKAMMGVIVGCMLLGNRLPKALKEMLEANDAMIEEMSDSSMD